MNSELLSSEPRASLLRLWLGTAAKEARAREQAALHSFEKEYMKAASDLMADCHAKAAAVYEGALSELEATDD